ncbi:DUF5675 family protein [Algoriphagus taiwanensis]|uniref:DUF5675 domain-containing protein n=1 Tax=Algoriphagus taiwanensis TaxID=1445656 RepID=A0ABQ6Q7G5_9BACT|nr:hypothetical protein Ataiwa_37880 [Algoriphagus taiwanensis]
MRLLLKRRYTPRQTLGRLYLGSRLLCCIREAPKSCYSPHRHCIDEGVYELEPRHTEDRGWEIRVGENAIIRHIQPDHLPDTAEMGPFTEFNADGKPTFTRLAFQKLLEELGELWERGEVVEMQVVGMGIPYSIEPCQIPNFS